MTSGSTDHDLRPLPQHHPRHFGRSDTHRLPDAATAVVGGGARWSQVIAAAAPHGLAPICGSASGVGVVGFHPGARHVPLEPPGVHRLVVGVDAGLVDQVGSLTPGKQADIVLLRVDDGPVPVLDPLAAVTAFAHPSSVDTVMVGGRLRRRHGRMLDVDLGADRTPIAGSRARLGVTPG